MNTYRSPKGDLPDRCMPYFKLHQQQEVYWLPEWYSNKFIIAPTQWSPLTHPFASIIEGLSSAPGGPSVVKHPICSVCMVDCNGCACLLADWPIDIVVLTFHLWIIIRVKMNKQIVTTGLQGQIITRQGLYALNIVHTAGRQFVPCSRSS